MQDDELFYSPKPNVRATIKLFCFPFAGGNSSLYISWIKWLHPQVELVCLQLPGRASRLEETPYTSMEVLTKDMLKEIIPLIDRPYIFFGYSLGAKIAFELMTQLKQIGFPLPLHFFAAASPAPHLPRKHPPIHRLPESEFVNMLAEYKGTPENFFQNDELLTLLLPMLRADFTLLEEFPSKVSGKMTNKVTIYSGESDDKIEQSQLLTWQELFTSAIDYKVFSGGHFFIFQSQHPVITDLNRVIKSEIELLNPIGA